MAKTPEQIKQSYYTNIEAKTGVSIPDWLSRIQAKRASRRTGPPQRHCELAES